MLQLENSTPFAADLAMFANEDGVDTLYIMVKASFVIGEKWTLADEQAPPQKEDVYWGEPEHSSLKLASDYHLGKPATDILMTGQACAPSGQSVRQLDVSLSVGRVSKTVRVFGDRVWEDGKIGATEAFQAMPLIYEKAFGGEYQAADESFSFEARNPVGCGFSGEGANGDMNGQPLPNLEDPTDLIQSQRDRPMPSCFAMNSPAWQPRAGYAGSYDADWQAQRAPFLPVDFDRRFFNLAHSDLIYPGFLQGGETVSISNMHEQGDMQFSLPQMRLAADVRIANGSDNPEFNLETLILEPNIRQLSMVWRASVNCDKRLLKVKSAKIKLAS